MRKSLIVVAALCAAYAIVQVPASEAAPEVNHATIGYPTVQAALTALKAKPDVEVREQEGWTIVSDNESDDVYALWSFVPVGSPAYPAVVKRITFEKDGKVFVKTNVLCQAAKAPCDALVKDFQALNEKIKAQMQDDSK